MEQGRLDEAFQHFHAGRGKNPRDLRFHLDLGELLCASSRHDEARPHFQAALACNPGSADAHHGLGRILMEEGRLDEAEAAFAEALWLDPAHARAWTSLARLQAERGDFERSSESARQALAIRPDNAEAYWRLAVNLNGRLSDREEHSLVRLLEEPYLPGDSLAVLHFSLATVRDRRGMSAEAAALFDKGHAIQSAWRSSRGQVYDAAGQSQLIDRMIAAFPAGAFGEARRGADPATLPVFVVGLPRSGTTLVEQVLASHHAVWGAGEVPDLFQVFKGLPELIGRPQITSIEALEHLNANAAETMARQYTERLAALRRRARPASSTRRRTTSGCWG